MHATATAAAGRALLLRRALPRHASINSFLARGVKTEARLLELGVELPPAGVPKGNFVMAARSGRMIYLSGHLPTTGDGKLMTGKASVVCSAMGVLFGLLPAAGYTHNRHLGACCWPCCLQPVRTQPTDPLTSSQIHPHRWARRCRWRRRRPPPSSSP